MNPTGSRRPYPTEVEELFAEFLARREAAPGADFDAFVSAHPNHASELVRIHEDWHLLAGVVSRLGGAARTHAGDTLGRSGTEWKARLEGRSTSFERYRLEQEIGRGGMGSVWRVWDKDLNRSVALKRLHDPSAKSRVLGRFLEEAQIAAQLEHPSIVAVHELGLDDRGDVYYTMPLVRGRNLEEVFQLALDGREGWTRVRVLEVLLRVCEAMAYAHSRGVVHRDLKPANIMVGQFGEVYVMDWGLARVIGRGVATAESPRTARDEQGDGAGLLTRDGDVIGTPAYMSPEQARGELASVGPQWDVYALGAILYRWLTGTPPHVSRGEKLDVGVLLARARSGHPVPVAELAPDVPPELAAIAERALAAEAAQRYASVQELADDLRAFVENRVVRAYRTGAWFEFAKWVRRNRATAAALAAALVVALGGAWTTASVEARARDEATRLNTELAERNADLGRTNLALIEAEALARRESEESRRRRRAAEGAVDFMVSVFDAADPSAARGREVTARDLLVAGRRNAARFTDGGPLAQSDVMLAIAESTSALDDFDAAWPLVAIACDLRREAVGPTHPDTLRAELELSIVALDKRLSTLAVAVCESVFAAVAGPGLVIESELAAEAGTQLALGYIEVGAGVEAEALLRAIHAYYDCALGPDDERRFHVTCNLGQALNSQGRTEEAIGWLEASLASFERASGPLHPDWINCAGQLGLSYGRIGRLAQAESLLRRTLDAALAAYGPEHTGSGVAMGNLAETLGRVGKTEEAEELRRRCFDVISSNADADDPLVLGALNNLAPFYQNQRRFDEALELRLRILDGVERRLGPDHRSTLTALNNLGWLHVERGELDAAEPLVIAAWQGRRKRSGANSPETAGSIGILATLRGMQARWDESEELHLEALRAFVRAGEVHPEEGYLRMARSLSVVYRETGRVDDARNLMEFVLPNAVAVLGPDNRDTLNCMLTLERICELQGAFDEALDLARCVHERTPENDVDYPRRAALVERLLAEREAAAR